MPDRPTLLAAHGHAITAHDALQAIAELTDLPQEAQDAAEGLRQRCLTLARKLDQEARDAPR